MSDEMYNHYHVTRSAYQPPRIPYRIVLKYAWRVRMDNDDNIGFENRKDLLELLTYIKFPPNCDWHMIYCFVDGNGEYRETDFTANAKAYINNWHKQ